MFRLRKLRLCSGTCTECLRDLTRLRISGFQSKKTFFFFSPVVPRCPEEARPSWAKDDLRKVPLTGGLKKQAVTPPTRGTCLVKGRSSIRRFPLSWMSLMPALKPLILITRLQSPLYLPTGGKGRKANEKITSSAVEEPNYDNCSYCYP